MGTQIGKALSRLFSRRKPKKTEERELWMRVGVIFHGTAEEIGKLIEAKDDSSIIDLLKNGQWRFEGDCYCPEQLIDEYNERYGTDYPDAACEYDIDNGAILAASYTG